MKKQAVYFTVILISFLIFNSSLKASPVLTADFTFTHLTFDIIQFNDQSTPPSGYSLVQWDWDFGDGQTSQFQNPIHQFSVAGTYNVCLIVVADSNGYTIIDTICKNATVIPTTIVTADFSYSNITCNSIGFTDLSTCSSGYNLVQWSWDFGDGEVSNVQNPVHQYSASGTYNVTLVATADSSGYSYTDTTTKSVTVYPQPSVAFTWNPEPTPIGQTTSFFGASPNQIITWSWDLGDGNISLVQNPIHLYANTGTYNVTLTVTDTSGCEASMSNQINVVDVGVVDFTWDQICFDSPTHFSVLSPPTDTGAVSTYLWEFGDGAVSNIMNPSYLYAQPGDYNVTLTITDTLNQISDTTKLVTIVDLPVSSFSNTDPACMGNQVFFDDSSYVSTGYITQWDWDFGDGNSQTILHPDNPDVTHIYDNAGTYTTFLTVTSSDSCLNTTSRTVIVNQSPIADFTYEVECAEDPVLFTDLSTVNGGPDIVSWFWNFGDTLSGTNDTSTLQNPSHLYSSLGIYTVELEITNTIGCTDTTTNLVTVTEPPVDFTFDNDCMNSPIQFEVDETVTNISEVISWHWDFGDGDTSSIQNPVHTYLISGSYNVILTIETIDGCESDVMHTVTIFDPPVVDIYPTSAYAIINDSVQFQSISADSLYQWTWDFGDGDSSFLENPVHPYTALGTYNISLTVTDVNNCIGNDNDQIQIIPLPYFPDSNAIWNTIGYNSLTVQDWRFRYGLIGDTLLSTSAKDTPYLYSKVYNLWDTTLTHPNSTYFGAIRNDNGKVYLKLPEFPETILYDFTAEVGDTIWFKLGGAACDNEIVLEETEHFKIVSQIDSVLLLDGLYHKQMYLDGEFINDIWVQGLGSTEWVGFLNPLIVDYLLCGDLYSFACLKENDEYLYIDNPECDLCFCHLLTDIRDNTVNENEIVIFPVPTNDILTINLRGYDIKNSELTIYNTLGNTVYSNEILSRESITINTSNWTPGIYSVVLVENSEIIATGKILVTR